MFLEVPYALVDCRLHFLDKRIVIACLLFTPTCSRQSVGYLANKRVTKLLKCEGRLYRFVHHLPSGTSAAVYVAPGFSPIFASDA